MAANDFFTGTEGVIKVGGTALAQVSAFGVKIANIVAKQRSKGDAYPTRKTVGRDLTGSVSFHWNPTLSGHTAILAAVHAGTELALILYPTGTAAGQMITVAVQATSIDIPSQEPESTDPVMATIEFECSGAPTIAAAA